MSQHPFSIPIQKTYRKDLSGTRQRDHKTFSILSYLIRKDYITAISTITVSTLNTTRTSFTTIKEAVTTTSSIATATYTFCITSITTIASTTFGM
jgi:hypothetical protein